MSKFDDRIFKSTSDVFYFQIIPKQLLNLTPSTTSHTINQETESISFKLYKGEQLSDESKAIIPIVGCNNNIEIKKAFINFNVTKYRHDIAVEFMMKLCAHMEKQKGNKKEQEVILEHCESGSKSKLKKEEIGSFNILANFYVDEFINNGTKEFNESIKINDEFCFEFDIFVEKSRFGLEKFIRESRETKKSGTDRKSMKDNLKRSDTRFQLKLRGPMINSPRSEVTEEILQNEALSLSENKFISPSRRIIKDKKLLVRNESIKKANIKISEESSLEKNQLNCERNSSNKKEKCENLEHQKLSLSKFSKNEALQVDKSKSEMFEERKGEDKLFSSFKNNEEVSDDFFEFPDTSLSSREIITSVNSNDSFINQDSLEKERNHSKISSEVSSNSSLESENGLNTKSEAEIKKPQNSSSLEVWIDQEATTSEILKTNRCIEFANNRFLVILFSLASVVILAYAIPPDNNM